MFTRETKMLSNMDFAVGGVAAMCACVFTNPLEVVKTRMQLQGELEARGHYTVHYRNVPHAIWAVARTDGIPALQKGLIPALWFQLFLNGFRLGTYQVADNCGMIRNANGDSKVLPSLFFGAVGGSLGAVTGSPFYLIKTQMQAQGASEIAVGYQHKHSGMTSAMIKIFKSDGIKGLYRGVLSSIPRASVGSASQMASFTRSKEYLTEKNVFPNSPLLTTFVAANLGGVVMTICMTPFDVVATRLYNQGTDAKGSGLLYNGVIDCFTKMAKTEGFLGFYKGIGPSYLRLGPHTVLVLVFWDQLKILVNKLNKNRD